MQTAKGLWISLSCVATVSAILCQAVRAQPAASSRSIPMKVGGVAVGDILQRLGARQEQGSTAKELDDYTNHFNRTDPNRDGKHTREEYVENGHCMTLQARVGIFRAADGNADGVVTRDEYVLNRIITDEAKTIVQGMDDDKDGLVERAEFVNHATNLLSDTKLAEQVYAAFDANNDGSTTIPEYLRVWGQWARLGQKSAERRIATRRAELTGSSNVDVATKEPVKHPAQPRTTRPGGGPPSRRPGAGTGPPSVDQVFQRFDGNKDGKLRQDEVPEFVQQFVLPADADGDDAVTKEELQAWRQRQRPRGESRPAAGLKIGLPAGERLDPQERSDGSRGIEPAPVDCPACAMGLTAEFVFKRLDVNEDGRIVVEEFEKSPGMRGETQAREALVKIDWTRTGVVSSSRTN